MAAVNGYQHMTTGNDYVRPAVDIDLTAVRSRITDLHAESISLATDLLAVLGPLQRYVTQALDQASGDAARGDMQAATDVDVIELTRTFEHREHAVLEVDCPSAPDAAVLDLSHLSF